MLRLRLGRNVGTRTFSADYVFNNLSSFSLPIQELASCSTSPYYLKVLTKLKRTLKYSSKIYITRRSISNNINRMSTSNLQHSNSDFSDDLAASRMERFLVVGLGNYIYPGTRHSVGMMAVDSLMCHLGGQWEKSRVCGGVLGRSLITTEDGAVAVELFLFKPQILMNINGKSVLKAAKHLEITADKIYLIHDELDKAVGKCGIKEGGSARGHKGVISCYDSLRPSPLWPKSNNGEFKGMTRLLIGIGRPANQSQIVSYVLSRFHDKESEKVMTAINNGLDLLLKHITSRILT